MHEEMLNFFGLTEDFTIQELKKQFRYLTKKYHPDNCSKTGIKLEESVREFTKTMEYYDCLTEYLISKNASPTNLKPDLSEYKNKLIIKLNNRINNELAFQYEFKKEPTLYSKYNNYYLIYQKYIQILINYYRKLIEVLATDKSLQTKQSIKSYIKDLQKEEIRLKKQLNYELFISFKNNYKYYKSLSSDIIFKLEQNFNTESKEKSLRAIFLNFLQIIECLPYKENDIKQNYQEQCDSIFNCVNEIIMHIISRCRYHTYYQVLLPEINNILSHYDLESLKKRLTTILSLDDQEKIITTINQEIANQINNLFLEYQKFIETKEIRINNLICLINHNCDYETRKKLLMICDNLQNEVRKPNFESQEKILHCLITNQINDYELTKEEFFKLKKMATELDFNKKTILTKGIKFKDGYKKY